MSRKVINGKMSVQCGAKVPSPYLRRHTALLTSGLDRESAWIVDLGCGNGRNSEHMRRLGFKHVLSFDRRGDYGYQFELGSEWVPVAQSSVNIILANYVLMFLNKAELAQTLHEISRMADLGCKLVVELYPALDGYASTKTAIASLQRNIVMKLGWKVLRESKGRVIAEKPLEAKQ